MIFETFDKKIQRKLNKCEIENLYNNLKDEIEHLIIQSRYNTKDLNIIFQDYDAEHIKYNLLEYYNKEINIYKNRIYKLKQNFGKEYPELFI